MISGAKIPLLCVYFQQILSFMKRLRLYMFTIAFIAPGLSMAQPNANIGVFAGTSYYMGDINPNRHFYRPSFSYGLLYRYNINTRYAIRANAYVADLSGSDLDFPGRLNPDRPFTPASFQTSLFEIGLQLEYNFLPFTPNVGNWEYTPYIATGIAGSLVMGSNVNASNTLSVPLGLGVKLNLTPRISTGAEWSFRKMFNDRVDGLENPSRTRSILHNNDWYSFLGVFITFKFFNFATECPAYN
jgi:opacity protein-like surface antigen